VAIVKTDYLRAKTNRKHQNPHAAKASNEEMPQFVNENDQAEDEQKGDDIAEDPSAKGF
jgi:hypothetical protein